MEKQAIGRFGRKGLAVGVVGLSLAHAAQGGVPFNNLQGAGGAAFNPLAYPAGQNKEEGSESPWSHPQFGLWYVHLGDVDVDWTALGVAGSLFERLELSYGYELVAPVGENITKQNVGAKWLLVPENAGGRAYIPAVAVGTLWKTTDPVADGSEDHAFDFYAVATKLVTQLPRPVLLSAGVLSTKEQVTGVFGYNEDRDTAFFGNVDILPFSFLAVGVEYKQGASYDTFENASYWNAHVAWFASKNLTLIGAYVNAGDETSTSEVGLGDGVAVGVQYAF